MRRDVKALTIELSQVNDHSKEGVLRKDRWAIPLCGGSPLHWVLGFVDHRLHQIGLYDSIPEIDSQEWAQPVSQPDCCHDIAS